MKKNRTGCNNPRESPLIFQWHITDKCNLNCRHCYQDNGPVPDPEFPMLERTFRQYLDLLDKIKETGRWKPRGHINITGGEPLLRDDLFKLLNLISEADRRVSVGILTNGTLVDDKMAKNIGDTGVKFVQVSMEGGRKTHDCVRGQGNFNLVIEGIERLQGAGISTYVSFTAHRLNYMEFGDVAGTCRKLGVDCLWADRLIPCGRGRELANSTLSPAQTRTFFQNMKRARYNLSRGWGKKKTEIRMKRSLQFLIGGGMPYRCSAGDRLITVMPDGTMYPCRRMPISVGNVAVESISDTYYNNEFMQALRDPARVPDGCENCLHASACHGGSRCLANVVNGSPFTRDPGCWDAHFNSLESPVFDVGDVRCEVW
ncbi:MAG: radical SAM protein [Methanobacteriota archaeon]